MNRTLPTMAVLLCLAGFSLPLATAQPPLPRKPPLPLRPPGVRAPEATTPAAQAPATTTPAGQAPATGVPAAGAPAGTESPTGAAANPEEAAIRSRVAAYVTAFNKHDANAVASFWSEGAVYVNRATGEEVTGRAAIAAQFKTTFESQPALKLDVSVESIRFLAPSVAVEHGTAKVFVAAETVDEIDYTAVYVKQGKDWLLDRVTDEPQTEAPPSHYDQLKVLEWMVGNWVDQDEQVRVVTDCHWAKNKNFLIRSFSVETGDHVETSGMQVIGWDASAKKIRSWTFDSNGGTADGIWSQHGDAWYIHNKGVLADGSKATMVNAIQPVDADSFTWQTIERTHNGEILPNVPAVLVVRQQ